MSKETILSTQQLSNLKELGMKVRKDSKLALHDMLKELPPGRWSLTSGGISFTKEDGCNHVILNNTSILDAAYEMLCWCIEEGYKEVDKRRYKHVMEDQVLTKGQIKELLGLKGMGPETIHNHSSMMFVQFPNPHPGYKETCPILERLVPASGEYYGLDDIDYIPTMTSDDIEGFFKDPNYSLEETKSEFLGSWSVGFSKVGSPRFKGERKIDALFELLKWYIENSKKV
jgi:hypothetical protein